ncbi:MAG: thiamine pyrophosphate-binding protein [Saprospiraceae bacterium]|nr:thiamine pyrophosphate-binding protein [Saprospiraceae bacterium]
MKKTGAELIVYALEQIGVRYTFGIPGTHTTEIYDALHFSDKIEPVLVTHEGGASFMADAISRTTDSIGCITIVPAAGLTHAMSGIAEAFLDGIPMLIISGGTRTDSGRYYQLHQLDLIPLVSSVTKAQFLINHQDEVIPTIYKAYEIAISGEPGPVFVEIPVNVQMFKAPISGIKPYTPKIEVPTLPLDDIKKAARMLAGAKNPILFLGWGARAAVEHSIKIAEKLVSPVAVTLQGKSCFPNKHPLFTSCFLGRSAKPSSQAALKKHDCMLAVGCRFSEISTGSYGLENPKNLIHIDINPEVFNKNYKAVLCIEGDAKEVLQVLWNELADLEISNDYLKVTEEIQVLNQAYEAEWLKEKLEDLVSPGWFFASLNKRMTEDTFVVVDDGKHTFLAAELLLSQQANHFISPTDFNCMGYCIPATIAVKMAHPDKPVLGIVGDGAALMTGLELVTAASYGVAPIIFLFNDGELGQITQFQKTPLNLRTCSVLGKIDFKGLAILAGIEYLKMENDHCIEESMDKAFQLSGEGRAVLVDVFIDYSKKTMLTKGVIKTNLSRFPLIEKIRFITRAVKRHLF